MLDNILYNLLYLFLNTMIEVDNNDKVRIAKSGANKLFEVDFETRKSMDEQKLIDLFNQIWTKKLEVMVQQAIIIKSDEVERRLLDKYHVFIDSQQEHRTFHYKKAEFIAQLQTLENTEYKLTQLWRVISSDEHPLTLFIKFSSIEERESFKSLAKSLDIDDEKLGLRLIRNFMNLHPGYTAINEEDT